MIGIAQREYSGVYSSGKRRQYNWGLLQMKTLSAVTLKRSLILLEQIWEQDGHSHSQDRHQQ